MNQSPYLSVVVTSRNDNHGGTLNRRMQIFIDCLIAQCKRHDLPAELIIVEWNPPADRPKLAQAMRWPADLGPCAVRIIEVPPEIHSRYRHAQKLPLYQMIAKNVGIRRARGQFILATNIDVILNDELMRFLAARRLERGRMYRIDRTDVDGAVPEGASLQETLDYCTSHIIRTNLREGTFPLRPDGRRALAERDVADADSGLTLGEGFMPVELPVGPDGPRPCRWITNHAQIGIDNADGQTGQRYLSMEVEFGPSAGRHPMPCWFTDETGRTIHCGMLFPGEAVCCPVMLTGGRKDVTLHLDSPNIPHPVDPRMLNLLVRYLALLDQPLRPPSAPDIVPAGQRIWLGEGWCQPERAGEERCRRIGSGPGEIWVEALPGGSQRKYLALDLEPDWAVATQPVLIRVCDRTGRELLRAVTYRRQVFSVPIVFDEPLACLSLSVQDPDGHGQEDGAPAAGVAVYRVELADAPAADQPPAGIIARSASLALGRGWYPLEQEHGEPFRWLQNEGDVWVEAPADGEPACRYLALDVEAGPGAGQRPVLLRLMDRQRQTTLLSALVLRRQVFHAPLRLPAGLHRLALRVETAGRPAGGADQRTLDLRARQIAFAAAPAPSEPRDITDACSLAVGSGWHDLEREDGQLFRWLHRDGEIWVDVPGDESGQRYLALDLESGPSAGQDPVRLSVVDAQQQTAVLSAILLGRQVFHVPVRLKPGLHCLRVHAEAPERPTSDADPRPLALRARRIGWAVAPRSAQCPDISDSPRLGLGRGWYRPEQEEGRPFRWLHNDGEVWVDARGGSGLELRRLVLDLEAGPSAGGRPVLLRLIDPQQQATVLSAILLGRQTLHVPVRLRPDICRLVLHVEAPDRPASGSDARTLNLRARGVRLDDLPIPAVPDDIVGSTAVALGDGWYEQERSDQEAFRWARNGAQVWVAGPCPAGPAQHRHVILDLEPAPRGNSGGRRLTICDESGHELFQAELVRRQQVMVRLAATTPMVGLVLRRDGEDVSVPGDARMLSFRAHRIHLAPAPDGPVSAGHAPKAQAPAAAGKTDCAE